MRYSFILSFICMVITSCTPSDTEQAVKPENVKIERPNYDFERALSTCIDFNCQQLPTEKQVMSNYNSDLMLAIGLSQTDTLAEAREKIKAFKKTRIYSSTIGSTTDPELGFLAAQMSPGPDKEFAEYDIVVRTFGRHNEAKIKDWGARIRCAPVKPTTIWQREPC